jgi:hypothetical protein
MLLPGNYGGPLPGGGDGSVVPEVTASRLARVLAFCGTNMDEVFTCPVTRRRVAFYLAVDREIVRRGEILELEQQWNPLGARP